MDPFLCYSLILIRLTLLWSVADCKSVAEMEAMQKVMMETMKKVVIETATNILNRSQVKDKYRSILK